MTKVNGRDSIVELLGYFVVNDHLALVFPCLWKDARVGIPSIYSKLKSARQSEKDKMATTSNKMKLCEDSQRILEFSANSSSRELDYLHLLNCSSLV